jgi:hypothetical protein
MSRPTTRFMSQVWRINPTNSKKLKIMKAPLLWPMFFQKNGWVFYFRFIPGWPGFSIRSGRVNHSSIFFFSLTSPGPRSTCQVSFGFITTVIIIYIYIYNFFKKKYLSLKTIHIKGKIIFLYILLYIGHRNQTWYIL